jgi:beta-galactosidase
VFVNGFNLGWYWPTRGPQMTLYVPGPILRAGANELVVLEVEAPPAAGAAVLRFVDAPDFRGPGGAGGGGLTAAPAPRAAARRVRPLAL